MSALEHIPSTGLCNPSLIYLLCLELGRLATRPPRGLRYILFFFNTILYYCGIPTVPYQIYPAPSVERRILGIPAHIYAPGRLKSKPRISSISAQPERGSNDTRGRPPGLVLRQTLKS